MIMNLYKCKNSVFCAFLLLCFFAGTICGVLGFRMLLASQNAWTSDYIINCMDGGMSCYVPMFFSRLRPFLILTLVSVFSFRNRIIPLLVLFRGVSVSYLFSAAFCAGCPVLLTAAGFLVFLSAYFWLSCRLYFCDIVPLPQCVVFSCAVAAASAFIQCCKL